MTTKTDALIAGAGPTGLVLALWLTRLGARVRIIDKEPLPGQTSRAVGVQARTLEFYRQMGLDKPLVDQGVPAKAANLWVLGKREGRIELDAEGDGRSPYPYVLIYPQDEHEKLLIARLAAAGVVVERPVELVSFEDAGARVTCRLRKGDGSTETCEAAYLAGCDGARSFVRESLNLGYPGGTYSHLFYVADVQASGPAMNGELNIALDEADFVACFPLDQARTHARLIGTVRADAAPAGQALAWSDINQKTIQRIVLDVQRVNWFSTYHVHHRVASAFRVGRAFLLGDAAHVHSPVGGQGMNTGIGDAVNLAWKLAAVVREEADASILDTYEEERVPFARRLVATTDRVFSFVSTDGPLANRFRVEVVPRLLTRLFRLTAVRRFMFNTVSQTKVNYRGARLSEGHTGRVRGGDRLPWVPSADGRDNFAPLASLAWQVHIYGEAGGDLGDACAALRLPLHVFAWNAAAEKAALARGAAYLVRPDGYVAAVSVGPALAKAFARYLTARKLRPGSAPVAAGGTNRVP